MLISKVNDRYTFQLQQTDGQWTVGHEPSPVDLVKNPSGVMSVLYKGKSYEAVLEKIDRSQKTLTLRVAGQKYSVKIEEPMDQLLHSMGLDLSATKKLEPVKAPMPGMILRILVAPGQTLAKGDPLLVLEAMKMENVLKSNGAGTVKSVRVNEGTAVEKGTVLIDLE